MRLGIGTYTFTWAIGVPGFPAPPRPLTPLDLLDQARSLGVRVVQFCDNLPLARLTADELEVFEARVAADGLEIELGMRGLDPVEVRRNLALARRFGCRFLRVVTDRAGDEPTAESVVERLRPLLPEFADAGVRIALENHDRFRCRTLAWIVEQLGAERAGICLDTVNSFGALEGPEVVLETLAPWTLCVHIKDFTIQRAPHKMGFQVEGCAAGAGRLDVPWLLAALRRSPHPFNAILETWVSPGVSMEETLQREARWAGEGITYLRSLEGV